MCYPSLLNKHGVLLFMMLFPFKFLFWFDRNKCCRGIFRDCSVKPELAWGNLQLSPFLLSKNASWLAVDGRKVGFIPREALRFIWKAIGKSPPHTHTRLHPWWQKARRPLPMSCKRSEPGVYACSLLLETVSSQRRGLCSLAASLWFSTTSWAVIRSASHRGRGSTGHSVCSKTEVSNLAFRETAMRCISVTSLSCVQLSGNSSLTRACPKKCRWRHNTALTSSP